MGPLTILKMCLKSVSFLFIYNNFAGFNSFFTKFGLKI